MPWPPPKWLFEIVMLADAAPPAPIATLSSPSLMDDSVIVTFVAFEMSLVVRTQVTVERGELSGLNRADSARIGNRRFGHVASVLCLQHRGACDEGDGDTSQS